ncbi:MAG TPA: LysR family transcriptional regulator [Baekduia sp.]|uniref:LysR family transcriptional regulator n=1 Tax=Baekduia sp. TaxID=2600305 RepID=UPI002D7773E0|nr:LysR family transcriptional regulator [Baekduia sp.]HET6506880.1 LysR family transcriptional regulator [Baekduia sp.]
MLDARKLRVLRAVAEHGSFAAAAAELRYTPSAISQQIAALEREAGAVLVERGPRGTRLTQAGAVLDRHAALVLGQLAAARAELEDLQRVRGGSVRVAAFESAWTALVPAAMSRYRAEHPGVELHLAEEDPVAAVAAVRAGTCDVAVVFEPNALGDTDLAGLDRTVVAHDPLWAVLPAGHPLAGEEAIDLARLAADPWVAPTAFCAGVVRAACARAGFEPDVVFSSADYGAVQGFVAAGAGVALVPFLALAHRERAVARPLAGAAPTRVLSAVTAVAGPRPESATAVVRTLRTTAEALLPAAPRARAASQSYV